MSSSNWMEDCDTVPDNTVMQQINSYAQRLRELEFAMLQAEEKYKNAKEKYDEFATKVLPEYFLTNGVSSIKCDDGVRIDIVTQTRASIKKGADDGKSSKRTIAEWLRSHGGEPLIKSKITVSSNSVEQLKAAGIPFTEDVDINTNSLKKFIIDSLGQGTGVATITNSDLPEGLSFYQWQEAKTVWG